MKVTLVKAGLGVGTVLILFLSLFYLFNITQKSQPFHIALIGPMSGPQQTTGEAFERAIHLYLDEVNQEGGIGGREIVLDVFDDQNNPDKAAQQARQIIAQNRAIAVIGHNYSSCSIRGGEVYKEYGIPAITPSSTNIAVTHDNPWYFRTIFTDNTQGRFLAAYVHKVFQPHAVGIIYEDSPYGAYLQQTFQRTLQEYGYGTKHIWKVSSVPDNNENRVRRIVNELLFNREIELVFLAMHGTKAINLVKLLKDNLITIPIIGPDSMATETFREGFNQFPKERQNPGFYTDGIYVATPLILDYSNEIGEYFKERYYHTYQESPAWSAAYAYDTVMVLTEAIRQAGVTGNEETVQEDRRKIRDYLASMTSVDQSVRGITGSNYFDAHGDSQKPVYIGTYKNRTLISALIQFQKVPDMYDVPDIEHALEEDRILLFDGSYAYQTNVVYTGIKVNEISELDLNNLTYVIDFYLWFRYRGEIDMHNIEFLNAVEPLELGEPLEQETNNGLRYRRYHVNGRFRADFIEDQYTFRQHVLGVSFRHHDLFQSNLMFVNDMLGMDMNRQQTSEFTMQRTHILSPAYGWTPHRIWFFQDVVEKESFGRPRYLSSQSGKLSYSRFNMGIWIKKWEFTFRRIIPPELVGYVLIVSAVLLLISVYVGTRRAFQKQTKWFWLLQSAFAFLTLLAAEGELIKQLSGKISTYYLEIFVLVFDVLWWFVPAVLLQFAAEYFLWRPLENRTNRSIPKIARGMVIFIIYTLALFGVVAFVFNQRLTGLLATSGVLAMIIGLAVQMNISNVFSGLAINVERPFYIGDWVKVGDNEEGKVVDITWRSTKIRTWNDYILSIPNSVASESVVCNYHGESDKYWRFPVIHVDPIHPPERVKKILLDAALATDCVQKDPAPYTTFLGMSEWSADYWLCVYFKDYANIFDFEEAVWQSIWTHLTRAGIEPAVQQRRLHHFHHSEVWGKDAIAPRFVLDGVDIFKPFSEEAKTLLSSRMHLRHFSAGDIIVKQGQEGDSLFIIAEGVVGIWVQFDARRSVEIVRRTVGEVVGEMALLTGEPRSATMLSITDTVLYEITKEDIAPFMKQEPGLVAQLSALLAERKKNDLTVKESIAVEEEKNEELSKQLFTKIRNFFDLT